MKKTIMTLFVAMVALCAQAQIYLGGTVGLATVGSEGGDDETSFKLLPEIGYNLNDKWAIGTTIGYQKGTFSMLDTNISNMDGVKAFTVAPYARWTFAKAKTVNVFLDMGFGFVSGEANDVDFTAFNIGVQPGIAINLNRHFSLVGKIGFLGYEVINPDGDNNNTHAFGFDANGNNIQFGLYYNF